jgi:hypothetical protein
MALTWTGTAIPGYLHRQWHTKKWHRLRNLHLIAWLQADLRALVFFYACIDRFSKIAVDVAGRSWNELLWNNHAGCFPSSIIV